MSEESAKVTEVAYSRNAKWVRTRLHEFATSAYLSANPKELGQDTQKVFDKIQQTNLIKTLSAK